jgi:hypothetical protein
VFTVETDFKCQSVDKVLRNYRNSFNCHDALSRNSVTRWLQKFEETGFVFHSIKGVVRQKRRLTADKTVHL